MAILHGSWIVRPDGGHLLVWGETWRRVTALESPEVNGCLPHPLVMRATELTDLLKSLQESGALPWQLLGSTTIEDNKTSKARWTMGLPTQIGDRGDINYQLSIINYQLLPLHSSSLDGEITGDVYLYPWQGDVISLPIDEALSFLQALPLNTRDVGWLGPDLRFWSHVCRWSLDLLARNKFLPGLSPNPLVPESYHSSWHALLDSGMDRARLEVFSESMPMACRMYGPVVDPQMDGDGTEGTENIGGIYNVLPARPKELIINFLNSSIDTQIRSIATKHLTVIQNPKSGKVTKLPPHVKQWLQSLVTRSEISITSEIEKLALGLKNWQSPLQQSLDEQHKFHACFKLHPPLIGGKEWVLEYFLQAADDPEFLVDANTIWNHAVEQAFFQGRLIRFPQETLLGGLGLAAKLCPQIEPSLQQRNPHACPLNPLQAYEFVKFISWRFTDSGLGVILPPSLGSQSWGSRLGLSLQGEPSKVNSKGAKGKLGWQSLLNFKWELSIGKQKLSKEEFDLLVAQNSPLVEVNGEWVELRPQDIRAAAAFFKARKEQLTLSLEDALRLANGDSQTIEKLPVVEFAAGDQLKELLDALNNNSAIEVMKTPVKFQGELRPYQVRGMSWLAFLEKWGLGACLADDMGLGKTIQLIAFLLKLEEQKALPGTILLVCPTSVLGNWQREVKKFAPNLKLMVHHGDKRQKGSYFALAVQDVKLVITSYPLVYRDLSELQRIKWQGIVLDEAQNIKNVEAKQSQAVRKLEANFRVALTGTPVENRLSELWSILDFLNPGYLGAKQFFQRRFAVPIEKYGDTASLQTLRSIVRPFILRRMKTDKDIINDLPEKQEITVFCQLSSEQAVIYQKLVETSLAQIEASDGILRRGMILGLLTKLKQVCNHPSLLKNLSLLDLSLDDEEDLETSDIINDLGDQSGKIQRLEEMLDEILVQGERALIFTQFAECGKLLQPYLEKQLQREIFFFYGSTKQAQREVMIDRFQNDPQGPPIMILSLKAGGTGLNLTRANHVFHFDRWWNPAVENQATDRVFRIGQTRNVQVHKFVCTGTLEEKIHDLIESKKALAEQVVSGGEQWLTELDTNQLRDLLLLDRSAIIGD